MNKGMRFDDGKTTPVLSDDIYQGRVEQNDLPMIDEGKRTGTGNYRNT